MDVKDYQGADGAMVKLIEIVEAGNGEWFWRAKAFNNRIVATTGETYQDRDHAVSMAGALFPGVAIEDGA